MQLHVILREEAQLTLAVRADEAYVGALSSLRVAIVHAGVAGGTLTPASWAVLFNELPVCKARAAGCARTGCADMAGIENELFAHDTGVKNVFDAERLHSFCVARYAS